MVIGFVKYKCKVCGREIIADHNKIDKKLFDAKKCPECSKVKIFTADIMLNEKGNNYDNRI